MRKKISDKNLLGAAAIYEDCQDIVIGERWRRLAEPFTQLTSEENLKLLAPLCELPFGAIVTTNYDRSQHDAWALVKKRAPIQIELDGNTMRGGADQTSFYIARIHGAAESPKSMVLYRSAYKELLTNDAYEDFLLSLLRDRPCLFVGFSFVDPAIDYVLKTYESKARELFKTPHAALLPAGESEDLHDRLSSLNIKAHFYDPANGHKDLWRAFRKAAADYQRRGKKKCGSISEEKFPSYPSFQRFLAFTYAQVKLSHEARPLLEQARDGVVLSVIRDHGNGGIKRDSLCERIRDILNLDENEADRIVRDATSRLFSDENIRIDDKTISAIGEPNGLLDESMTVLVDGVMDRMKVGDSIKPSSNDHRIIHSTIEKALMVRSWDLAAHYAGGGTGYGEDIHAVINDVLGSLTAGITKERKFALERSCIDLLTHPTDDEADHLAEVSRAAFSLQLVLSSPRQSLFQRYAIPHRVYLDASVLLPAIAVGHPLYELYKGTIRRLQVAAKTAGITTELCVGSPFLNEVISHRRIAVEMEDQLKINDEDTLRRRVGFYGAENMNVFIGAYSGYLGRHPTGDKSRMSFTKFLAYTAPYTTEGALEKYLISHGFRIVPMDFRKNYAHEYTQTFNGLLMAYEEARDNMVMGKEKVLVEHEAKQLVQLKADQADSIRSVFVTNDRKLRRATVANAETRPFADRMLPPEGFVGLVDIMVGIKADKQGLARLVWATPRREADRAIRDYLIRRALETQEVAYAKAIPQVIGEIVEEAKRFLEACPINISDGNKTDTIIEAAGFMDRFEAEFFEKMREAIEKQER